MPRCSNVLAALVASLSIIAMGACSGSSTDSDGDGGSGGKKILDSGTQDVTADVQPEAGTDAAPDVSQDASLDQSVEAEAGELDAEVLEGSLFDLNMPDVLIGDSGATLQGCYDCATVSCTSEMQACEQDDKCRTMLLCLFEDQCFGGPNGIEFSCGLSCASQAGISGMGDPAVSVALAAGECISGSCQDECGLPADGGLPFDGGMPDGF